MGCDYNKLVVLVVEDDPLLRIDLTDWIEDEGLEVLSASIACAAIDIIRDTPRIHAVVTDIEMPGAMNGIGLAHYLGGRFPGALLLITSGGVWPREEELPPGAIFLVKPFDPLALVKRIVTHAF